MNLLRKHWFDLGGFLALIVTLYIVINFKEFTTIQLILYVSLVTLFLHQFEEYRFPGYFPGMLNSAVYKSNMPDRFPLNTQTSLFINVFFGWTFYLLAAVFANKCIWLGIATMMISLGNFFAHTFMFNIKGKTLYNPGTATAVLFFLPLSIWFFTSVAIDAHTTYFDWIVGIASGLLLNYFGIIKLIDWMASRNTHYIFENYQLIRADRTKH